ncbi:MAG: type II secretion system protein GspL [Rhodanobacteraceae bacterium]
MNERLLIRIDADGALSWWQADRGTHGKGAPPASALQSAGQVVVLVPGADVLLLHATLPPGSAARLAQVLPYALEDQVLDDVETLHFVAGPRREDGQQAVAVVARERMQAWRELLVSAGVAADLMLPDTLAVPLDGDGVSALLEDGRCLVRRSADLGFACAVEELPQWLAEDEVLNLLPASGSSAPEVPAARHWRVRQASEVRDALVRGLAIDSGLNLLMGDFAARHRRAPQRRLWRMAALLAGAAILIGLVGQVTSVLRLRSANAQAETLVQQRYASLFPESPPVPDPVARVRSELTRMGGSSQDQALLGLLSQAAPILASHDFRLDVLGLEYRNKTLELSVRAPSLGNLDQLRERLATLPGVQVELTAATPGSDGVEGRLSMTGAGA